GLRPEGHVLLLVVAVIWFAGALYASGEMRHDPNRRRFAFWFLLSMAGNVGLVLAHDAISFFVFFALMSLSAYGLVVHKGDYAARRAAKIYMIFVVIGETALFVGLVLSFGRTGSLDLPAIGEFGPSLVEICLLAVGFGIKAGLLGLHMWLPLAHPAAPVPASAILSGAMLTAGLIGLVRFLPPGDVVAPEAGNAILTLGISGALYAALIGLTQRNPKTVLAYSSVSQLGLALAIFGVALATPSIAPVAITTIIFFTAHHGLAKAALFLGLGLAKRPIADDSDRWIVMAILTIAACTLIGLAPTSGYVAKSMLAQVAGSATGTWAYHLPDLLTISSIATALLMLHFLRLAWPASAPSKPANEWKLRTACLSLLGISLALPWLWDDNASDTLTISMLEGSSKALAPLMIALALMLFGILWRVRLGRGVPAGDLISPLALLYGLVRRRLSKIPISTDPLTAGMHRGLKSLPALQAIDGWSTSYLGLGLPFGKSVVRNTTVE
ncbi:MAG: complex I subunit 5 family protein, partial [Pseudomonadota bacterium]